MGQIRLPHTVGHLNLMLVNHHTLVLPKLLQVHHPTRVPLKIPLAHPNHQAHILDHQMSFLHTQENSSVILF
jgi:hypothetical protein